MKVADDIVYISNGKNIKLNTARIIAPFAIKAKLADIPAKLINIFGAITDCFIILKIRVKINNID